MIRYELPYPPTANNLFTTAPGKRVKSREYKSWRLEAMQMIMAQGRRAIEGHVSISILVVRPDKRKRDVSNLIKAVEDVLVEMRVIRDDSLVARVSAQWAGSGPACVVLIQEAEEALAA